MCLCFFVCFVIVCYFLYLFVIVWLSELTHHKILQNNTNKNNKQHKQIQKQETHAFATKRHSATILVRELEVNISMAGGVACPKKALARQQSEPKEDPVISLVPWVVLDSSPVAAW